MRLRESQLAQHLAGGAFETVYLVSGDEQLLVDECCDAIAAAARSAGFDERTLFDAGPRAAWGELFAGAANLSLFSAKRLLDVRIPPRGLDRAGSDALRRYLGAPLPDTLLLCRAVGLDWRAQSSAWHKAIDKAGAVLPTRSVSARDLPRWLADRCRAAGLDIDREALDALAERVEGNLLAAKQEIEKLKLLLPDGRIGSAEVRAAVGDSAHFDTFETLDAALGGEGARAVRMAATLRQEGVAIFMVLGALAANLRRLRAVAAGAQPRLPRSRIELMQRAARRLGRDRIEALLADCALLDQQAKGMMHGDAWRSLERLLLALAGRRQPTLAAEAKLLRP